MNTNPMTANTVTMFQWITRPIARFTPTAMANTTTTAIAANTIEPLQFRVGSFDRFDCDRAFEPEFDLTRVLLRGLVQSRNRKKVLSR